MSLDAYKERQDRAFDTFRSKFILYERPQRSDLSRTKSAISKRSNGRTESASSFGDLSGQAIDNEELDMPSVPVPQLTFSPQIRRLQTAPWETNADAPTKTKKSRTSIMRKFRRVTSSNKVPSSVMDDGHDKLSKPNSPDLVVLADRPQRVTSTVAASEIDKPLGKPLGLSILQEVQQTIAFGPVDPNILHLRHPVGVIQEDAESMTMKPSRSTPQIEYEVEHSPQRKDRMSRMFDSLHFD